MSLERVLGFLKTAAQVIGFIKDLAFDVLQALSLRQQPIS